MTGAVAVAAVAWPLFLVLSMILDWRARAAAHRRVAFWQRIAEWRQSTTIELLRDNDQAHALFTRATSALIVLGGDVDPYLDWLRSSEAMSRRHRDNLHEIGKLIGAAP